MKALKISALLTAMLLAIFSVDAAEHKAQIVDSGSFGIFVDGKRVGTETFQIEQRPDMGVASSELKVDDGKFQADQTSEMQITPSGDLKLYKWHSLVPQKEDSTVEPKDELLVEHIVPANQKKMDFPHILPVSTVILDDYFFSHREVLLWRYLKTNCKLTNTEIECSPGVFVVLVPRQHTSSNARIDLVSTGKIKVKGVETDIFQLKLQMDGKQWMFIRNESAADDPSSTEWLLWVDRQLKVVKMAAPGSNVEIIRD